jgi:hypothetical protein
MTPETLTGLAVLAAVVMVGLFAAVRLSKK